MTYIVTKKGGIRLIEILDAQDLIFYLSFASLLLKMTAVMGFYFFRTLNVNHQSQHHTKFASSYDVPFKKAQKSYNENNSFAHWLARCVRRIESSDESPAPILLENKSNFKFQGGLVCHQKQKEPYPPFLSVFQLL